MFNRDMLLPIPLLADYNLIRERRQALIDENNLRANRRRRYHDYAVGDRVLIILNPKAKLGQRTSTDHYRITRVHANGNVTIERSPGVYERLNIRRIRPYNPRP